MRYHLAVVFFASVFLVTVGNATPPATPTSPTTQSLAKKTVLQLLLKNTDLPLSKGIGCKSAVTSSDDRTLGDYFAGIWQHHANPKTTNQLKVSCTSIQRNTQRYWQCDVVPHSTDGKEVFWSYGVRLYVDAKTRALDRSEFVCIGAG